MLYGKSFKLDPDRKLLLDMALKQFTQRINVRETRYGVGASKLNLISDKMEYY